MLEANRCNSIPPEGEILSDADIYAIMNRHSVASSLVNSAVVIAVGSLILFALSVMVLLLGAGSLGSLFSVLTVVSLVSLVGACIVALVASSHPRMGQPLIRQAPERPKEDASVLGKLRGVFYPSSKPLKKFPFSDFLGFVPPEVKIVVDFIEKNTLIEDCQKKDVKGVVTTEKKVVLSPTLNFENLPIQLPPCPTSFESLKEYLGKISRQSIVKVGSVPGDGNCFFHSMSYLLRVNNQITEDHTLIRKKCCQWLLDNFSTNPGVCQLLYADLLTAIDQCFSRRRPKPKGTEAVEARILHSLSSNIEDMEGDVCPVENVPFVLQIPREGTHPVCQELLKTYINALSGANIYVGSAMGHAFSQVYRTTLCLYPETCLSSIKAVTSPDTSIPLRKAAINRLKKSGCRFSVHPDGSPTSSALPLLAHPYGVCGVPMTAVFGAEFQSSKIFGYVRVGGAHFEPIITRTSVSGVSRQDQPRQEPSQKISSSDSRLKPNSESAQPAGSLRKVRRKLIPPHITASPTKPIPKPSPDVGETLPKPVNVFELFE